MLTLGGCALATGRPAGRVPTGAEIQVLEQAIRPLLNELGFPWPRTPSDCRVALTVWQSSAINASTGPGRAIPCLYFNLGVTQGALERLPVDLLRAILAHELGHVIRSQVEARNRRRAENGGVFAPIARRFDQQEETEADRFAVQLLRKLEPQYPGACIALVHVFALLGEQQAGHRVPWLNEHPSPARRQEVALDGCER